MIGLGRRYGATDGALGLGLALNCLLLGLAALSYVWTPGSATEVDIAARLLPPGAGHPFGTDHLGRDVAAMIMVGARNSIAVSLVAVGLGLGLGVPLGLLAAARGGLVDDAVMRANDVIFAFPSLLLAIMLTAALGPGAVNAILAIGVFNVPVFARATRGSALSLWRRDFILAARVAGKGPWRIAIEHILPNILGVLVVQATIQFSLAIVAEAALSYVGLGAQPPTASWGRMLNDAQTYAGQAVWLVIFPGLAVVTSVLGLNLLGDGLRDRLDPRARRERGAP